MSQSSLIVRKGGPSNATRGQTNTEDDIICIPDCDLNDNVSVLLSSAASFTSADANKQRPLIQGTQGHNSGNSLKRPQSPIYGRHHSPQSFSKDDELYRNDKRRKNSPSKDSKDTRGNRYQTRDHISSGRLDNRHSHSNKEVWSRLEIPNEREHQKRGNKDHHHSQSNSRHRSLYQAPQHKKSSTMEWRQRSSNDTKRARAPPSRDARHAPYAPSERSRATYDSQRTISDNHVSLESGEMVVNRETDEVSETSEEERI
ncbi:LOW QUALITY PROTEIN: hypothetical protein Bca4012_075760 [Brassica carinata]